MEDAQHRPLRGEVVEADHLYLSQFEYAVFRAALRIEEIGIGVTRSLQEGIERAVVHAGGVAAAIRLECLAQP